MGFASPEDFYYISFLFHLWIGVFVVVLYLIVKVLVWNVCFFYRCKWERIRSHLITYMEVMVLHLPWCLKNVLLLLLMVCSVGIMLLCWLMVRYKNSFYNWKKNWFLAALPFELHKWCRQDLERHIPWGLLLKMVQEMGWFLKLWVLCSTKLIL